MEQASEVASWMFIGYSRDYGYFNKESQKVLWKPFQFRWLWL